MFDAAPHQRLVSVFFEPFVIRGMLVYQVVMFDIIFLRHGIAVQIFRRITALVYFIQIHPHRFPFHQGTQHKINLADGKKQPCTPAEGEKHFL